MTRQRRHRNPGTAGGLRSRTQMRSARRPRRLNIHAPCRQAEALATLSSSPLSTFCNSRLRAAQLKAVALEGSVSQSAMNRTALSSKKKKTSRRVVGLPASPATQGLRACTSAAHYVPYFRPSMQNETKSGPAQAQPELIAGSPAKRRPARLRARFRAPAPVARNRAHRQRMAQRSGVAASAFPRLHPVA